VIFQRSRPFVVTARTSPLQRAVLERRYGPLRQIVSKAQHDGRRGTSYQLTLACGHTKHVPQSQTPRSGWTTCAACKASG
jgi:hypothetical protein